MDDEFCTAMLTTVFAAVMIVFGLVFIAQRKQDDVTHMLRSAAIPQTRAMRSSLQSEPSLARQPVIAKIGLVSNGY